MLEGGGGGGVMRRRERASSVCERVRSPISYQPVHHLPASEVPIRCAKTSTMIFARYLEDGGMRVHRDSLTGLESVCRVS